MSGPRWFFTAHAVQRCREMGVEKAEVLALLAGPDLDYVSMQDERRRCAMNDRLFIVYEPHPTEPVVVTVLWRTEETYERDGTVPPVWGGAR